MPPQDPSTLPGGSSSFEQKKKQLIEASRKPASPNRPASSKSPGTVSLSPATGPWSRFERANLKPPKRKSSQGRTCPTIRLGRSQASGAGDQGPPRLQARPIRPSNGHDYYKTHVRGAHCADSLLSPSRTRSRSPLGSTAPKTVRRGDDRKSQAVRGFDHTEAAIKKLSLFYNGKEAEPWMYELVGQSPSRPARHTEARRSRWPSAMRRPAGQAVQEP